MYGQFMMHGQKNIKKIYYACSNNCSRKEVGCVIVSMVRPPPQ